MTDSELIYLIGVIVAFLAFSVTLAFASSDSRSRRRSAADVENKRGQAAGS